MYKVVFSNRAKKSLSKLDKQVASIIMKWIVKNLVNCDNPREYGHALKGKYASYWRYRIGHYRIIALIEDTKPQIIAIDIGHRHDINK